jgi:hypothetical protein
VRSVCVEVDIVAALDRIVNSVGWWKFGYLGRSSIRLVLLRLVSEAKTRGDCKFIIVRVEVMSDAALTPVEVITL